MPRMHSCVFLIKPSYPLLCFSLIMIVHPIVDVNNAAFEPGVTGMGEGVWLYLVS